VAALPAGYLGWIRATVQSNPRMDMLYVHPSYLQMLYASDISTRPAYFTIEGSSLKTRSSDTTDIELLYNAKNAAVSSSLNWLFTNHPDAYLFGSLAEAGGFSVDTDSLAKWSARRDAVFNEIMMSDFRAQGPMSIRVAGATP
jgi:hypothetical protein